MRLNNRTAIVTGASMGIGAATTVALARKGVTVWAVARSRDRLEAMAADGFRIHPIVADVSDTKDRERIFETAGSVDILVNNAGLGSFGLCETMEFELVEYMFEVNVLALIDMTQRALPHMLEQGSGHICNVGSSVSYLSGPPLSVYAATKSAVAGFSDGLRREVFSRGVGVSLIQPGPVRTGFLDRASGGDRANVADRSGNGMPAWWVSNAILKAVRYDHVPGFATVAVPRPLGLGRVLDFPGVSYALDVASTMIGHNIWKPPVDPPVHHGGDADVIPLHGNRDTPPAD